jgi:hypothetical protein
VLHLDAAERLLELAEQGVKQLLSLAAVGLLELGSILQCRGQLLLGWWCGPADGRSRQRVLGGEVERTGQLLGVVGVHHLEDRLPQPGLRGRPCQRCPGAA